MVQRYVSRLITQKVRDPRVEMVTVTDVEVNADTTQAHIYYSVLGDEEARAEAQAGLESAAGFLRRELGQLIRLRNTPELIFHWDASIERGERIVSLLDQLKADDQSGAPESE